MERSSQLLKGVLDMCLLAVIAEEPSYGYEMARKLESRGLDLVGEGGHLDTSQFLNRHPGSAPSSEGSPTR